MTLLDFSKDYILENNRVLLRPLVEQDYYHLVHFSVEEPELWTYSTITGDSPEKLKSYIDYAFLKKAVKDSYPFIIYDKLSREYAGCTRFYDFQEKQETVQLGYTWIGKEFQGTGLNKNCKFLLLEFAFETLDLHRVEFRADNDNKRSIAAMKSIGCQVEGIIRQSKKRPDGTRRDSIILSILKEEWNGEIKAKLKSSLHS